MVKRKKIQRVKLIKHDSDEVGYGKPPKHTQFQPGQSGNPKGRPTGTKNLKTDFEEELSEPLQITEGGRTKTISKQRGIVKRTVTKAVNGDARATDQILKHNARYADEPPKNDDIDALLREDEIILERYLKRKNRSTPSSRVKSKRRMK
ncbi:MAG: hypothetical protein GKR93_17890 [Gammaproteobacteria bacterium]|nr:hypothetical protein [Gammaproteobacteria bacterium]